MSLLLALKASLALISNYLLLSLNILPPTVAGEKHSLRLEKKKKKHKNLQKI